MPIYFLFFGLTRSEIESNYRFSSRRSIHLATDQKELHPPLLQYRYCREKQNSLENENLLQTLY